VISALLIPPLGGIGAALASMLAYTAAGLVVTVIFLRTLGGRVGDLAPRASDVAWMVEKVRAQLTRRPVAPSASGPGEPTP
jgi:Na+-driven multidrug efflux pump